MSCDCRLTAREGRGALAGRGAMYTGFGVVFLRGGRSSGPIQGCVCVMLVMSQGMYMCRVFVWIMYICRVFVWIMFMYSYANNVVCGW